MRAGLLCSVTLAALVVVASAHPLDTSFPQDAGDSSASLIREKRTVGVLRQLFPNFSMDDDENAVAESNLKPVRAKREAAEEEDDEEDLESEATGDNNEVNDDEEDEADSDDEEDPRNKRFLNFNLGGSASATTGAGSGGGSGNFIFDIIRLIAGSGTTAEGDEAANGAEGTAKDAEGNYGVGVPGPLTRLFVIANRGVASLIQDLILRMAQTSERLVNFKARLITSII